MRLSKLLLVPFLAFLGLMSCQTDYQGQIIPNAKPDLAFSTYNPGQMYLTKKKVRINWHCNDQDGLKTKYYYAVSTSQTINESNVMDSIPLNKWNVTDKMYADIAFPYIGQRDSSFFDPSDSTYIRYVWSKVYLYAVDEDGNKTAPISREFWRTNNKPARPIVQCPSFLWDAEHLPPITGFTYQDFQPTSLPRVFLKEQTSFWNPVLFRWNSDDPDSDIGDKVVLQYRWELRKVIYNGVMTENQMVDSNFVCSLPDTLITTSGDWSSGTTSTQLDDEVFNAGEGYFKFIVKVKDDGDEESASPCICFFEAFRPTFDKGVFLYNTTALIKDNYTSESEENGNPNKEAVRNFYKNMMASCGFTESSTDPLKRYEYYDGETVPNLKKLSQYRLIISVDDDRINKAADFNDDQETFFGAQLREYLNMGGKILVSGTNRFFDNASTFYLEPQKFASLKELIRVYFGLAAVTTGESYQARKGSHFREYDFVGMEPFGHVQDSLRAMIVDSAKINTYWTKKINAKWYKIKGKGIFLPGVTTLKAQHGEIIWGYKSIFNTNHGETNDLEVARANYNNPGVEYLTYAGGYNDTTSVPTPANLHRCMNRNDFDGLQPGVMSAVASRYIPDRDNFRTAFIGVPLFFMDNQNNNVYYNIKKMINWFDLTQVPQSVVSGKK